MATAKIRIEMPADLEVSDPQVRSAILRGVRARLEHASDECLHKALPKGSTRQIPHRYVQGLVDQAEKAYRERMGMMIDEIIQVLTA